MLNSIRIGLARLMSDHRGITSMEYAVLALGMVAAVASAASALGNDVGLIYDSLHTYMANLAISGS